MKVRAKTSFAAIIDGQIVLLAEGEERELSDEAAKNLAKSGLVEIVPAVMLARKPAQPNANSTKIKRGKQNGG